MALYDCEVEISGVQVTWEVQATSHEDAAHQAQAMLCPDGVLISTKESAMK